MQPVAILTGASRGLGKTLAEFLARQNYQLVLSARGADALNAAADQLLDFNSAVYPVAGDIADPAHRQQLYLKAQSLGRLDVLINNASELGDSPMPLLSEIGEGSLRQIYNVNVFAPLMLLQACLGLLSESQGLVVNLSSDAALGGYSHWGGYGSSKAALDLIGLTLAHELADSGISVVTVDPGDMRTAMHQAAFPGEDISDRPLPDVTLPFWGWLLGQTPQSINGQRLLAQADRWESDLNKAV